MSRRLLVLWSLVLLVACGGGEQASSPTPQVAALSAAERGQLLFRNKGCVTCHNHGGVGGEPGIATGFGPNLTTYRNDPAYLRRWLADPQSVKPTAQMPNLQLSAEEIELLIAFINR